MLDIVKKTIFKSRMLSASGGVVVGLSGGADSVALLVCLLELRGEPGLGGEIGGVFAAHINHNLRGAEADADEAFVRRLCEKTGVELKVYSADVNGFAAENGLGTEEAARVLRYEFLQKARVEFGAVRIAVGHNADDNAETVIMNLCRGAGLRGLGGIAPVNGHVIRPLIEVSRAEIEAYLHERGIEFVTDKSNASNDFTRNRVRKNIIPLLEAEVNASAGKNITKTAELLRSDDDFMESAAREAFIKCTENTPNSENLVINAAILADLHPALRQRVIRYAVAAVRGSFHPVSDTNRMKSFGLENITATHILAVCGLLSAYSGREVHLPGIIVSKEYDALIFAADRAEKKDFQYDLHINSTIFIPEISKAVSGSFTAPGGYPESGGSLPTHCTKAFSYDRITLPLVLRARRDGDKIAFKAADGRIFTKKLQDYFTDEKIPRTKRDEIPLIAHGDEILWIMDGKNRTNARFSANPANSNNIYITVGDK